MAIRCPAIADDLRAVIHGPAIADYFRRPAIANNALRPFTVITPPLGNLPLSRQPFVPFAPPPGHCCNN
jgi:hypothetical protein